MWQLFWGFVLFQLGIRVWFRLRPQPIPHGWSWLLENPWRRVYRDPERTADACQLRATDTVLELGCGSGLFTRALAGRCARLIASDLSQAYLNETAVKTRDLTNLELLLADATALPLPDSSVDAVVLISALTEVPEPVKALLECRRVLRPGGRVVVSEELFAPEYVTAGVTDRWASQAGLTRVSASGNTWVYLRQYVSE